MNFVCISPPVIGELDPTVFSMAKNLNESFTDRLIGELPENTRAMYASMASIASIGLEPDHTAILRPGILTPGATHIPNFDIWHTDNTDSLVSADNLPTEFLVGDNSAVKALWKFVNMTPDAPNNPLYYAAQLSFAANRASDRDLEDLGFSIWPAQPYEIVSFNGLYVHRPPTNKTELPVSRTLIGLSF